MTGDRPQSSPRSSSSAGSKGGGTRSGSGDSRSKGGGSRTGSGDSRSKGGGSRTGSGDSRSKGGGSRTGSGDSRSKGGGSRTGSGDSRSKGGGSRTGSGDSRSKGGGSRTGSGDSRGRGDERGGSRTGSGDTRGRGDERGGSRTGSGDSRGRSDERGGRNRDGGAQDRSGRTRDGQGEVSHGRREAGPKTWGGVARRGAAKVGEVPFTDEPEFSPDEVAKYEARVAKREAEAAAYQRVRDEARDAVERAGGLKPVVRKAPKYALTERELLPRTPKNPIDPDVALIKALGKVEGQKAMKVLLAASEEFADERFRPAELKLKKLSQIAPEVPEVRELLGLALYRQERWAAAAKELEEFRRLAGSTEQHPVLADAYRAQRRWADVEALWDELRDVSPSAALVTEGRVVVAGAHADQGDLSGAIRLLERKWSRPKRPKEHHLSRAYALADLYERSGDNPRARDLFGWIAAMNPQFGDARLRAK